MTNRPAFAVILFVALITSTVVRADDLTGLIQSRLALMDEVAAYKWHNSLPIEDLSRESIVLTAAAESGLRAGVVPDTSRLFFAEQINAAKEIQRYWFAVWETGPAPLRTPPPAPDLNEVVRPELIRLGELINFALANKLPERRAFLSGIEIVGLSDATEKTLFDALSQVRTYPNRLSQILSTGVLRVGTTGDYAPFSFRASSDHSFTGIDIDLATDLAKSLDVRLVLHHTGWPSLTDDLQSGHYDIAMSGVSRNVPRQKIGYFSDAYHVGGKTPIVRCEDKGRFDSLEAIDREGIRVIVNPGGTNEQFLDTNIKRATKILHDDNRTIFAEITGERADVMFTDAIEVTLQTAKHSQLCAAMPGQTLTYQEKGYLMPQDEALRNMVNLWLANRIGDGTLEKIFERHLERRPPEFKGR